MYLAAFYKAEQHVSRKLNILGSTVPPKQGSNLDEVLQRVEAEQNIEFTDEQLEAIRFSATKAYWL